MFTYHTDLFLKKNCFVVKEWDIIDKKIGDSLVDIDQLYTIIPRISHCLILLIVYTVDFDRLRLFHLYWICELKENLIFMDGIMWKMVV